jgi:hypothetical protein
VCDHLKGINFNPRFLTLVLAAITIPKRTATISDAPVVIPNNAVFGLEYPNPAMMELPKLVTLRFGGHKVNSAHETTPSTPLPPL